MRQRQADNALEVNATADVAKKLCLIWAGLSIGGVWIAAPAKFTTPSLSLATALEVGRAQFLWLSIGQLLIGATLLLCLGWTRRFAWRACGMAILSFLAQLFVLVFLDRITLNTIHGAGSDGGVHAIYLVLEAVKLTCLLVAGFAPARSVMQIAQEY